MLSADKSAADTHRAILAVWREFARLEQAVEAAKLKSRSLQSIRSPRPPRRTSASLPGTCSARSC